MAGQIFKKLFHKSVKEFKSISAIDKFIEKKTGKKMKVAYIHQDICSSRGSVYDIKEMSDPGSEFDKALAR